MRRAVHDALVAGVPEVHGRVYQPHSVPIAPEGSTHRADLIPFLVVDEGAQSLDGTWNGLAAVFDVWIYEDEDSFEVIDQIEAKVVAALHNRRFLDPVTGVQFLMARDQGASGRDAIDSRWIALTRVVRFRAYALTWLSAEADEPDPVKAMQAWTAGHWAELGVDPATWTPTDTTPGVYWRTARLSDIQRVGAGAWITVVLMGHVLAPGPAARRNWVQRIIVALALDERAWMLDGGPLNFGVARADSEADAMRSGQIELTARYGVLHISQQPRDTGGVIREATVRTRTPAPAHTEIAHQTIIVP